MMNELIDTAIQNHLDWLDIINRALRSDRQTKESDLRDVGNEHVCRLGQWLSEERTIQLLGPDLHFRAVALHGTFHEIAGYIAINLDADDRGNVTRRYLAVLQCLSSSLIELLRLVKRRINGEMKTAIL